MLLTMLLSLSLTIAVTGYAAHRERSVVAWGGASAAMAWGRAGCGPP